MERTCILKIVAISLAAAIFLIAVVSLSAAVVIAKKYNSKIFPGVHIAAINLSSATKTEAKLLLDSALNQKFLEKGFIFFAKGEKVVVGLNDGNGILVFNSDAMVQKAFDFGRNHSRIDNQWKRLTTLLFGHEIALDYQLNKELLQENLSSQLKSREKPFNNASISIKILDEQKKDVEVTLIKEQAGGSFRYLSAINKLDENLQNYFNLPITLESKAEIPKIYVQDVEALLPALEIFLKIDKHELVYLENKYEIPWAMFVQWLTIGLSPQEQAGITLDKDLVKNYLSAISQTINQEAKDAKFQITNNKVTEFQASETGRELDIDKSFDSVVDAFILQNKESVDLVVNETLPRVATQDVNNLGIKELVGVGVSNYAGSPPNRIHNIGVGSASLNGLLIKPDEEFSLNKALGKADASTGYLQEMVIKGDKTIPEYGGGLCQIGTTMFRVALAAGLSITERRPHSYRVVYYEPAGTDATIYTPHPDVRFVNDTGHYLLLQTKIIGLNVRFELWGAKDGRKVSFEGQNKTEDLSKLKPVIYNITQPGPPKEVESDKLAPGEKKRTEIAHNGADAYFYRFIEWPAETNTQPLAGQSGAIKEKWSSHYVPWQAVWLIGVDPAKKASAVAEAMADKAESLSAQEAGALLVAPVAQ
ncbi:VanW family protein [Candidatus Falkowbacteria bacterium]|nr:VanW family protein [Candidatus Falkowbacteria bacterium]